MTIDNIVSVNAIESVWIKRGWSVVLFPDNDGILRFYVDHRKFNALKVRDSYSVLRMYVSIGSSRGDQVFSILDRNNDYWHIGVQDSVKSETVCLLHYVYEKARLDLNTPEPRYIIFRDLVVWAGVL